MYSKLSKVVVKSISYVGSSFAFDIKLSNCVEFDSRKSSLRRYFEVEVNSLGLSTVIEYSLYESALSSFKEAVADHMSRC